MVVAVSTLFEHGARKYLSGQILRTSASCQWSDVAAELRQHPKVVLPPIELKQMEVCIATRHGPNTVVTRRAGGEWQETVSEPGMVWLCPMGVREEEVNIRAPIELLHMYLPAARFDQLAEVCGGSPVRATSIGYVAGARDELIRQIGVSFLAEMKEQTASGRVLIEALTLSLTARLAQAYSTRAPVKTELRDTRHGLGDTKLRRVLDFMRNNLDEDIGIEDLAKVACLSPFHFTRMFRNSMGVPPHRYLSTLRLDRAKTMLALSDLPLAEIALLSCFSSQANFNRAFLKTIGMTPGAYRRGAH